LRGGVVPETEAATADRSVSTRFRRPFNEFFVVALEGPASFVEGPPRAALDSITDLLRRERYVRTLISYHGSGDSLLLSRDGRLTFFIASVDAPRSDSAGHLVVAFRKALRRALDRVPCRDTYSARGTAGMAVLTSGLTVVVGFGALVLTPLIETRSLGIGGLIVVGVAVLLSTTLLPALLAMIGRDIDRPRWLARRLTWYHSPLGWEKWARSLARHPARALVLGSAAVAVLTAPLFWI